MIKTLVGNSTFPLRNIVKEEVGLLFFFKPDCSACKAQVKEFSCLKDSVSLSAIGFGDSKKLWIESKKLGLKNIFKKRVFYAGPKVLKVFKIKDGISPQLFLYKRGEVYKNLIGLNTCEEIKKHL